MDGYRTSGVRIAVASQHLDTTSGTAEVMLTSILESQTGISSEIARDIRHEDLITSGQVEDSSSFVDS